MSAELHDMGAGIWLLPGADPSVDDVAEWGSLQWRLPHTLHPQMSQLPHHLLGWDLTDV